MKFDSLIFDLDGTLWDASATYAKAWCECLQQTHPDRTITPEMLFPVMGMEQGKALAQLLPDLEERQRETIYAGVAPAINRLIPQVGGNLYAGVKEGVVQLATKYRLFIVSNCQQGLIDAFLNWSGLQPWFSGYLSYGDHPQPKSFNIQRIVERYRLERAVYIGDTDSDRQQANLAGVPFVFMRYGFGDSQQFYKAFDTFGALTAYFMGDAHNNDRLNFR